MTHLVDFTKAAFAQKVHEQVSAVQNIMRLKAAPLLVPDPFQSPAAAAAASSHRQDPKKKRKGYHFWRLLNEKPSFIPDAQKGWGFD